VIKLKRETKKELPLGAAVEELAPASLLPSKRCIEKLGQTKNVDECNKKRNKQQRERKEKIYKT
jgi:hypothetical protein